ncbi:hypothetical protein AB0N61_00360 [Microbacterium sp. NPDC089320]|uniref:hypothetical protein n=1 Tax=Microbacterium sp. NPDC089320 TaxID=3155182 RepID=UPI003422EDC3
MTTASRIEQMAAEADQQRAEREASRVSYRGSVPEDWQDEYDRVARRMQPRAAASVIRDRVRRRKAEAAIPVAEAVMSELRQRF